MENNILYLIIDVVLYVSTLVYIIKKKRTFNAGIFVFSIMTVSHLGAILYYFMITETFGNFYELSLIAFIYLYLLICLCLYPYIKYSGFKKVEYRGPQELVKLVAWIIIVINAEPFLENVYVFFVSKNVDYANLYADAMDMELNILSRIGKALMHMASYYRLLVVVLIIYFVSNNIGSRKLKIGLFMCALNYVLFAMNSGSRGNMTNFMFMLLCGYLLTRKCYNIKFNNRVKKIAMLGAVPLVTIFTLITLSRYEASSQKRTLDESVLLYLSEGPIKFSDEMWDGKHNTNGDVNFTIFKDLLGTKTYTTYQGRDDHYLALNGRRIEVFYTYIGDFLSDLDYLGAIILCYFLFYLANNRLKHDVISLEGLAIVVFIIHLYSIGFASNLYRSYNQQLGIFYSFVVLLLLYIFRKIKTCQ